MGKNNYRHDSAERLKWLWAAQRGHGKKRELPMGRWIDPADYHMDEFGPGPDKTNSILGTLQVAAMLGIITYGATQFSEYQLPQLRSAKTQQTQVLEGRDLHQDQPPGIRNASAGEGDYWVEIPDTDAPLHRGGYQLLEKGNHLYAIHGNNIYALKIIVPKPGDTINGILLQYGLGNNNLPEDSPLVKFIKDLNTDAGTWEWNMLRHGEPGLVPERIVSENEVRGATTLPKVSLSTKVERMILNLYFSGPK